jgi:hypothetical protein
MFNVVRSNIISANNDETASSTPPKRTVESASPRTRKMPRTNNYPLYSPKTSTEQLARGAERTEALESPDRSGQSSLNALSYNFESPARSLRSHLSASSTANFNTPQSLESSDLTDGVRLTLEGIGIPKEAIEKLNYIQDQMAGNYAICGSAALAIHANNSDVPHKLTVNDLDVVYTGSTNPDSVAMGLKSNGSINSPKSKLFEPQGQILMINLKLQGSENFKIDVVPNKENFATEFVEVGGLSVASLTSLKTSYTFTQSNGNKEKAQAAEYKLGIINSIESKSTLQESDASSDENTVASLRINLFGFGN